jgi:lysophospholipase L1-like esterase
VAALVKKLAVAGAAAALALTGAELAVRAVVVSGSGATDFESYRRRCLGGQLAIFAEDAAGELVDLQPGTRQGTTITVNRFGFRGKPVLDPKPLDGFRVCCIGGSGCFGTTSSDDSTTFPAFLEAELRKGAAAPEHVEVMNGGLPGATTALAVSRFEKRLAERKPDVVLLYNLINDLLTSRRVRLGVDPRHRPLVKIDGAFEELLSNSAIYLTLASASTQREKEREIAEANRRQAELAKGDAPRGPGAGPARRVVEAVGRESSYVYDGTPERNLYLVPEHLTEFRAELLRFDRVVRAAGAVPVYCTFALRFRGDETQEEYRENGPVTAFYMPDGRMAQDAVAHMNGVIRQVAKETGSALCDVAAELPRDPAYFPPKDTDHFTDAGCQAAAAIMAAAIRKAGLTRGAAAPK